MRIASLVLIGLVAIEHVWFFVLEVFLWTTPTGLETFKTTQQFADQSIELGQRH